MTSFGAHLAQHARRGPAHERVLVRCRLGGGAGRGFGVGAEVFQDVQGGEAHLDVLVADTSDEVGHSPLQSGEQQVFLAAKGRSEGGRVPGQAEHAGAGRGDGFQRLTSSHAPLGLGILQERPQRLDGLTEGGDGGSERLPRPQGRPGGRRGRGRAGPADAGRPRQPLHLELPFEEAERPIDGPGRLLDRLGTVAADLLIRIVEPLDPDRDEGGGGSQGQL